MASLSRQGHAFTSKVTAHINTSQRPIGQFEFRQKAWSSDGDMHRRWHDAVSGNVVTAAELEKMSPAEQQALFDASVVTDLDQVPAEFLKRVRLRLEQHIEQTESAPKQQ